MPITDPDKKRAAREREAVALRKKRAERRAAGLPGRPRCKWDDRHRLVVDPEDYAHPESCVRAAA